MFTKKITTYFTTIPAILLVTACMNQEKAPTYNAEPFNPRKIVSYLSTDSMIIDGVLDEPTWDEAIWTPYFVDIEGEAMETPRYSTRAKISWDKDNIYFAAQLQEPNLWATFTERESIIFQENNFEVFIDPDADTHDYFEYEINALGTEWDLEMNRPYKSGGRADSEWDVEGIRAAVTLNGTINNPSDQDTGWVIEIAMPWKSLLTQGVSIPKDGDIWRLNFSRVEWKLEVQDGEYVKIKDQNGKNLPENNWVWSPTGEINMHMPEMWGFVKFSTNKDEKVFELDEIENYKWELRQVFYLQNKHLAEHSKYASDLSELGFDSKLNDKIEMNVDGTSYSVFMMLPDKTRLVLNHDSKIYIE